jgi:hypothetical protein
MASKPLAALLVFAGIILAQEVEINVDETSSTGHTWAVVSCKNGSAQISFGPADSVDLTDLFNCVPSTSDFQTGTATIKHAIRLNEAECQSMVREIKRTEGKEFCLALHNCTTTVLNVLKAGGVDIYSNQGGLKKFVNTTFATPGALANELRQLEQMPNAEVGRSGSSARRVPRPVLWRCKYKNVLHKKPVECARPDLGGEFEIIQ